MMIFEDGQAVGMPCKYGAGSCFTTDGDGFCDGMQDHRSYDSGVPSGDGVLMVDGVYKDHHYLNTDGTGIAQGYGNERGDWSYMHAGQGY